MTPVRIRYRFVLPDGSRETFDLFFDANDFHILNPHPAPLPFWTELGFNQCENCPLRLSEHTHCPVAVQLVAVIERLERLVSYDQVRVDVHTVERVVTQETTAQQALSSLLGLIMASSGCPRTEFLRPMARFHLPLASEHETIFRSAAAYALAQILQMAAGAEPDAAFNGLKSAYAELHKVNRGIAKRISAAARNDPARNAVVLLDAYTTLLPNAIDQSLSEMRPLFAVLKAATPAEGALKAATPADGADPAAKTSGERAEAENGSGGALAQKSAAGAAAQTEPADIDETTPQ